MRTHHAAYRTNPTSVNTTPLPALSLGEKPLQPSQLSYPPNVPYQRPLDTIQGPRCQPQNHRGVPDPSRPDRPTGPPAAGSELESFSRRPPRLAEPSGEVSKTPTSPSIQTQKRRIHRDIHKPAMPHPRWSHFVSQKIPIAPHQYPHNRTLPSSQTFTTGKSLHLRNCVRATPDLPSTRSTPCDEY